MLPNSAGSEALRAGLLAMGCAPVNLPPNGAALEAHLERLALEPQTLVFFDVSNDLPRVTHRFNSILKTWPHALRARTVLTRLEAGHVSPADRAWVQTQGFADLMACFDGPAPTSPLRKALDRVAATVGLSALGNDVLDRCLRTGPRARPGRSPREVVRAHTGLDAEALADLLQFKLDIRDRSYHLKLYPACFLGSSAVAWMRSHFKLDTAQAIGLGQALQALGLLYHVAHEQAFANKAFFFRLRAPVQLPSVRLGLVLQTLRERLVVQDHSYLGKNYPRCWTGEEAVDALCAKRDITRHESQLLMHRLMQFGFFEHVLGEHGFVDGNFFYRFTDSQP